MDSRDEARIPRLPMGEKEGERVDLNGYLPWDRAGSEADDRGEQLLKGAGQGVVLVVAVVLGSRYNLLLREFRQPPTRRLAE